MSAFPAGYCFNLLSQVDSTNMHAMQLLYAGLSANGEVYFTHFQTKGKGQRGKQWLSAPGDSILMSIVLDTNRLTTTQGFRLSAAMAVAVKDFIEFETQTAVSVKWPNDLYAGDKKAGGILIENIIQDGFLKWSVVGIGINVNQQQFPADLPAAVSLSTITGKIYDTRQLASALVGFVDRRWKQLLAGGWSDIYKAYNQALFAKNTIVKLRRGSVIIPCKIKSVTNHGMLVAGENDEWRFAHGEVDWLLPPGGQ